MSEATTQDLQNAALLDAVRMRLADEKIPFFANDNVHEVMTGEVRLAMKQRLTVLFEEIMRTMLIDTQNDHNTKGTAARMAKMYMTEVFRGRFDAPPKVTTFPNAKKLDELYTTGPITIRSACSHHFVPIMGKCWIGVIPKERLFGLSKFNRVIEWIASRPQIQEELAVQIADYIEQTLEPVGVAVVIKATHMCMTWRGVREEPSAVMTTSVMRGKMLTVPSARQEFFELIKPM